MELIDVIQRIAKDTAEAMGPLAVGYATVKQASPLVLTILATRLEVSEPVAVTTENVRPREATVQGERVIINPGLSPGDRVLVLRANAGQNYIVISKA